MRCCTPTIESIISTDDGGMDSEGISNPTFEVNVKIRFMESCKSDFIAGTSEGLFIELMRPVRTVWLDYGEERRNIEIGSRVSN